MRRVKLSHTESDWASFIGLYEADSIAHRKCLTPKAAERVRKDAITSKQRVELACVRCKAINASNGQNRHEGETAVKCPKSVHSLDLGPARLVAHRHRDDPMCATIALPGKCATEPKSGAYLLHSCVNKS